MPATLTPGSATRDEALTAFAADGCSAPRSWGNGPGDVYGSHEHAQHKVLFCVSGSIVFHGRKTTALSLTFSTIQKLSASGRPVKDDASAPTWAVLISGRIALGYSG